MKNQTPEHALELLTRYNVQTPGGKREETDYEIFRAADGHYFYKDIQWKAIEPISELEAVKDWIRNTAPKPWVQLITRALTVASGKGKRP